MSALPASAFVPDLGPRGEILLATRTERLLATPQRLAALDASPAWQAFRARHGAWSVEWNAVTGTPHRASGPAFPLAGFTGDSAGVDDAVRGFIAANAPLFGLGLQLEARSVRHHGAVWYASYRQLVGGLEVLFADWEFRVSDRGTLMLFGADAWRLTAARATTRIATAAARAAATEGIAFTPGRDRVEGAGPLALLPSVDAAGNVTARTVEQVRVRSTEPVANWYALVDAQTGAVLMRVDQARPIGGHISGMVHPRLPTDPLTLRPFAGEFVYAGADSAASDAAGAWTIPGADTVTFYSELRGPFVDVARGDIWPIGVGDASVTTPLGANAVYDFSWGDTLFSHDGERDAFYHGNVAHAYLKHLEPAFEALDYPLTIVVNYPYSHCNAVWAGSAIYLFSAGQGCVNTATSPTVLYHEYGHAVNDYLYFTDGFTNGMLNASLQEGTADLFAAFATDEPEVGGGFNGPGTFVRDVYNRNRWPDDVVTDVHVNGLIVAGAFWDLRRAVGLAVAERLAHQAKHGHPDDEHDIIAFKEMFLEVLVADDNDGDLANGTPHLAAIARAFSAHGIGPNAWLAIDHSAVSDPPAGGPVPIVATIRYTGPVVTALDAASPTVHYAVNGGPFSALAMTATGAPDEFGAAIPASPGSIVSYYLTARDGFGDETVSPVGAPSRRLFEFVAGPALPAITWDMESAAGWTVGAPDDDAISGVWERVDPTESASYDTANFVVLQPANDHSPNGTQCWVTGNADTMYVQGYNDVDNGKTTLVSPIFDAAPSGYENPVIDYWRWYTNNCGSAIGGDAWRVELSNNGGGAWVPVETYALSANSWERRAFRIEDVMTPTHSMRLRFIANDDLPSSLVEAALDDVRLLVFPLGTAVAGPRAGAGALELAAPWPNPSRGTTTLRLTLPSGTRVAMGIYDVGGRRVRSIGEQPLAAGEHLLAWDGLDDDGRAVPAGLYLARLDAGGAHRTQRVVRIR